MNQPFNEVKASSIPTVILDCDLSTGAKIGGGTATDNTAALNTFLATASATNPIKLILDGPTAVRGLIIAAAGYTIIEGIGRTSGIWIISGSNADPINNGKITPMDPNTTPPASGANITLRNFQVNGNRGNGTTGDSNSGNPRGVTSPQYWYCNINLANIVGIRIEDMYIYDAPAYGIRLNNCSDIVIANCTVNNPNTSSGANNDCIHIDGPATDIRIYGNDLTNNNSDDAIALNAPEGYAGVIDRAVIFGNTIHACLTALRVYGIVEGQVGRVIFSDCVCDISQYCLALGATGDFSSPVTGDCSFHSLLIRNISYNEQGGAFIGMCGGMGDLVITDCEWVSPITSTSFIDGISAGTVSSITINNCRAYRTPEGADNAFALLGASAALTIERMTINGFAVVDEQSESNGSIPELLAMTNITIGKLFVASLDYTNITALADSYANIGSLQGPGVIPTNAVATKTSAYTVLHTDGFLRGDCTSAAFSMTLPAIPYLGEAHTFKKIDTVTGNALTISGNGKNIDGAATNVLTAQYAHVKVVYNGTTWDVV